MCVVLCAESVGICVRVSCGLGLLVPCQESQCTYYTGQISYLDHQLQSSLSVFLLVMRELKNISRQLCVCVCVTVCVCKAHSQSHPIKVS